MYMEVFEKLWKVLEILNNVRKYVKVGIRNREVYIVYTKLKFNY